MSTEAFAGHLGNYIDGRHGLVIPAIETSELDPGKFLQFFKDILSVNAEACTGERVGFSFVQAQPSMQEIIIPGSEKPSVVMRYQRSGGGMGDIATHEVLKEPERIGGFDSFLSIRYALMRAGSLTIKAEAEDALNFNLTNESPISSGVWIDAKTKREVRNEQKRMLGRIADDFIELVS